MYYVSSKEKGGDTVLKKRSIFTFGLCFVLFASLLLSNVILAQDGGGYDPWIDTNDDGIIDAIDLQALAAIYSQSGTPINKTELLLELEARLDSLNLTLLTEYYNITECDVIFVDASGEAITGYLDVDSGTLYVDNSTDRVGVGTTSPMAKLEVSGNASIADTLYASEVSSNSPLLLQTDGITRIYIDDITGNVGIGATIPTSKLDVAGDITGEILRVDQIQLGSSDGNRYIYIYEDGSPTGEYIWWYNLGDRFIISNDIQVQGKVTIPTTTRYYSIPGCAWLPEGWYVEFLRLGEETHSNTGGGINWYVPINLPHGAVVTELRARVYDLDLTYDVQVTLFRQFGSTSYIMAGVNSNNNPGWVQHSDDTINYATIDNQNYVYYLRGQTRVVGSDHRLGQVRITYTVTETLP